METWQIIHIPDKPQVPPEQQKTDAVSVYAAVIEPKLAHSPVRRLHQIAPLENIRHLTDSKELINSYRLSSFITKVSKYAALSKEEWEEQCKLWPTSYHPPT
ncbi:hypothetical protein SLA2020_487670 [Shorea laevis]